MIPVTQLMQRCLLNSSLPKAKSRLSRYQNPELENETKKLVTFGAAIP